MTFIGDANDPLSKSVVHWIRKCHGQNVSRARWRRVNFPGGDIHLGAIRRADTKFFLKAVPEREAAGVTPFTVNDQ